VEVTGSDDGGIQVLEHVYRTCNNIFAMPLVLSPKGVSCASASFNSGNGGDSSDSQEREKELKYVYWVTKHESNACRRIRECQKSSRMAATCVVMDPDDAACNLSLQKPTEGRFNNNSMA
jgi:hypothetical protein